MESGLKNIWKLDEYFDISSLLQSLDTKEISYQNEMKVFALMFPQVWSVCKTISELSPLWWNGNAFYSSLWERDVRWMHREVKYLCICLSMSMVESSWLRWALSWGNRHVYTVWTGSICFKIARSIIVEFCQLLQWQGTWVEYTRLRLAGKLPREMKWNDQLPPFMSYLYEIPLYI